MSLVVTGLNHRTGSIELRERLGFAEDTFPKALAALRAQVEDAGTVR